MGQANNIIVNDAIHGKYGALTVNEATNRMSLGGSELAYLSDITQPADSYIHRIEGMFELSANTAFIAELHRTVTMGGRSLIKISCDDIAGDVGELTITPKPDFGPRYNKKEVVNNVTTDENSQDVISQSIISIAAETESAPSVITIPADCNSFNIEYFLGEAIPPTPGPTPPVKKTSYYVTPSNEYRYFSSADTPFSNFSTGADTGTVNIDGVEIEVEEFKELMFGQDYNSVVDAGEESLIYMRNLTHVKFPSNIQTIGKWSLAGLTSMETVILPDTFTTAGDLVLCDNPALQTLVIPDSVTQVGEYFCYNNTALNTLKISQNLMYFKKGLYENNYHIEKLYCGAFDARNIDPSSDKTDAFKDISSLLPPRTVRGTRYHDTQELADAFLESFPNVWEMDVVVGIQNDLGEVQKLYNYAWLG